jgi:hypothetical protein
MITYFVVNEKERNEFEMKFQVPYGYNVCPHFQTEECAIGYVDTLTMMHKGNQLIVEKWENGNCKVIYRSGWYKPEVYDEYREELEG